MEKYLVRENKGEEEVDLKKLVKACANRRKRKLDGSSPPGRERFEVVDLKVGNEVKGIRVVFPEHPGVQVLVWMVEEGRRPSREQLLATQAHMEGLEQKEVRVFGIKKEPRKSMTLGSPYLYSGNLNAIDKVAQENPQVGPWIEALGNSLWEEAVSLAQPLGLKRLVQGPGTIGHLVNYYTPSFTIGAHADAHTDLTHDLVVCYTEYIPCAEGSTASARSNHRIMLFQDAASKEKLCTLATIPGMVYAMVNCQRNALLHSSPKPGATGKAEAKPCNVPRLSITTRSFRGGEIKTPLQY